MYEATIYRIEWRNRHLTTIISDFDDPLSKMNRRQKSDKEIDQLGNDRK